MYTSQAETPTATSSYAESTKYVADILSSMANGGVENPSSWKICTKMTMDYHHPYNVYPEYYCPSYQGPGYQYPPQHQQQQQQQHLHQPQHLHPQSSSGPLRNFNNNIIGPPPPLPPPSQHHHVTHQQQHRQQPYFPPFQPPNHSQQHSSYSSPYLPNFLVSTGSGLTPTLTPTTLATIEQSFLELQSGQQNGGRDPITQSGFVPPVVDPGHSADVSQDSLDYSSEYSNDEWEPKAKRGRMDMKNVDLIVTSSGTINAAPQRKYTRRNKDEKLPPEEEERRRVRRERNKIAAAKCRQRRVDHTNELVEETEKLEAEQSQLESEIQSLQQEREQLEFILQAHQPLCKVDPRGVSGKVKVEPRPSTCSGYVSHSSLDNSCPAPENLSMSASTTAASTITSSVPATTSSAGSLESSIITSRPNSLPLIKRDRTRMLSMTSATGVTINTPTSGVTITPSSLFCPGLDSMVDGSTGLTPLTGMSCSSQVQRNSSDSSSEAVGSPTLISL